MSERINPNYPAERRFPTGERLSDETTLPPLESRPSFIELHYPAQTTFCECISEHEIDVFTTRIMTLPDHLRGFLTVYTPHDYREIGAKLYLADNAQGGYGLIGDELISVFSLPGAHLGAKIIEDAITRGAMRVDVLDAHKGGARSDPNNPGKLVTLYSAFGFREVQRNSWNTEYAPVCWDYALWGYPDHVIMVRDKQ